MRLPLYYKFQTTSLFKAFVINGIVAAIIATLTIELRLKLENEKSYYYLYSQKFFNGGKLTEIKKVLVVFIVSFLIIFIYLYNCKDNVK